MSLQHPQLYHVGHIEHYHPGETREFPVEDQLREGFNGMDTCGGCHPIVPGGNLCGAEQVGGRDLQLSTSALVQPAQQRP